MARAGRPRAKCPPAPGRTMIRTPAKPARAAKMRSGPILSPTTKAARGTSQRLRVKDRALASARGMFWKA